MKTRPLFVINAIVALPFGIGSVLAPDLFLSLFGAKLGPAGSLMMQFAGAWLIGIGLLTWLARNASDHEVQRNIALAFMVMYIVALVVALLGQFSGVLNALGWLVVVINACLALGYGYALFTGREATKAVSRIQQG